MKKILLFLLLFFISFLNVYGALSEEQTSIMNTISGMDESQREQFMKMEIPTPDGMSMTTVSDAMAKGYLSDGVTGNSTKAALDAAGLVKSSGTSSSGGPDDLTSSKFMINVSDISPGISAQGTTTSQKVNWILGTIIQNMMIALGVLSVLMMTVGAGYIVLHNGQDELLSKGKSIFMSGIYAMLIALTSYYLVAIVRFLLYSGSN